MNTFEKDRIDALSLPADRDYVSVSRTMEMLWEENPLWTLLNSAYIRMQRADEGKRRYAWIAVEHPDDWSGNLMLFMATGSWQDIFDIMRWDLFTHGWKGRKADWWFFYNAILAGLLNDRRSAEIRKYLPAIRSGEHTANTLIGRWLAGKMFPCNDKAKSYKAYRICKSSGIPEGWSESLEEQAMETVDLDRIGGRTIALLAGETFLGNHGLDKESIIKKCRNEESTFHCCDGMLDGLYGSAQESRS